MANTTIKNLLANLIDEYKSDTITELDRAMMKTVLGFTEPLLELQCRQMAGMDMPTFNNYYKENVEGFISSFKSSYRRTCNGNDEKLNALCQFGAGVYGELLEELYASINNAVTA